MDIEEPQYICLNYCMPDQETGACLTCGRPPIPVAAFNPMMFGRLSLESLTIVETAHEMPDETLGPEGSTC